MDVFAARAKNYLNTANDTPVYPAANSIANLEKLNTLLQEESMDAGEVLALLDD